MSYKRLITIIIILLFSGNVYAKEKYFDENYIFQPSQKIKWLEKTGTWPINWDVHGRQSKTPWALKYSDKIVRDGKYSLRFEKREKDCGVDDCTRVSAKFIGRSEVTINSKSTWGEVGSHWYSSSIYIPEESNLPTGKGQIIMGQFKTSSKSQFKTRKHVDGWDGVKNFESCPEINLTIRLNKDGLMSDRQGVMFCNPWANGNGIFHEKFYQKLVDMKTLKGKWNDLIINANWTDNEEGFIKIWVNGKLKLDYIGKTISKIKTIDGQKHGALFRFGIYSQKWPGTIIAYFDNIKRSKVCEKLIRCQIRQNN